MRDFQREIEREAFTRQRYLPLKVQKKEIASTSEKYFGYSHCLGESICWADKSKEKDNTF